MATQITFTQDGNNMVSNTMSDWNTPSLQLFITKLNNKTKSYITIKAAVKDGAEDDEYAVVYSAQCNNATYVFKINNTTDGVSYKIICENCSAAEGYYMND